MIVDDIGTARIAITKKLNALGAKPIEEARDGIEVIEMLRENPTRCGMLLLDINLTPMMDRIKTLLEVRTIKATKDLPVVLVRCDPKRDSVMNALKLGAGGFVKGGDQFKENLKIAILKVLGG